jgi:hypothetical protein
MSKLGIIQSRGIGDIVIALPIAKHYADQGHEIYWPICEDFVSHFKDVAPWVNWMGVPVDPQGQFFLNTPLERLKEVGIELEDDILYLYQYLSSVPERTDPDLFAMMKFDQYKYATTGVPFAKKWTLSECITRDPVREQKLYDQLVTKPRYMVYQGKASDVQYEIDLSGIEDDVEKIEITEVTDCIFDWLKIIEGAETIVLIDSVFANLIDQLKICESTPKYFMRKWNRRVDGNPVLLGTWGYIPVEAPPGVQVQSLADVAGAVAKQQAQPQQRNPAVEANNRPQPTGGSAQTYSPFGQTQGGVPTSFMSATKQGQQEQKKNSAQSLLAGLGLRQ